MTTLTQNLHFYGMAAMLALRDRIRPRRELLAEAKVQPGETVLDFGCGPGGYIAETSRLVGPKGQLLAIDRQTPALDCVRRISRRQGLRNVRAIQATDARDLADDSVDLVLLHDVFHLLSDPNGVLRDLARVLKPRGRLSVTDPHWPDERVIEGITGSGLFVLSERGALTLTFCIAAR